jgi:hypothetical protein
MGLFGGVEGAKYSEGGAYIDAGVFRLEIQAFKAIKTRAGKAAVVAEFKALEVSGDSKYKPGSLFSWMTMENDNFLGNVKNFAAVASACYQGVTEVDDTQITEAVLEALVAETGPAPNPLKGVCIRASAINVPTKKGGTYTKVKWIPDATDATTAAKAHADNR